MRRPRSTKSAVLFIIALVIAGYPSSCIAQTLPDSDTWTIVDRDGDTFTLSPVYLAPVTAKSEADSSISWSYNFAVHRVGRSTSRTKQGGPLTPTPGVLDTLSTTRITAQPGDTLTLILSIHHHDRILAQTDSTFVVPPSE
jgi:hypothetical protein